MTTKILTWHTSGGFEITVRSRSDIRKFFLRVKIARIRINCLRML